MRVTLAPCSPDLFLPSFVLTPPALALLGARTRCGEQEQEHSDVSGPSTCPKTPLLAVEVVEVVKSEEGESCSSCATCRQRREKTPCHYVKPWTMSFDILLGNVAWIW